MLSRDFVRPIDLLSIVRSRSSSSRWQCCILSHILVSIRQTKVCISTPNFKSQKKLGKWQFYGYFEKRTHKTKQFWGFLLRHTFWRLQIKVNSPKERDLDWRSQNRCQSEILGADLKENPTNQIKDRINDRNLLKALMKDLKKLTLSKE